MKKSLFALAALGAFAGAAQAQSSVTLYGNIDASIQAIQNGGIDRTNSTLQGGGTTTTAPGGTLTSTGNNSSYGNANPITGNSAPAFVDGAVATSLWGMKGTEDLGGGMTAFFQLESDALVNNGTTHSSGMFRRAANVGLSGSFGSVRLGLQNNPVSEATGAALPVEGNTVHQIRSVAAYSVGDFIKNAVSYESPSMSGLKIKAAYGMSNTIADNSGGTIFSSNAIYDAGPLRAFVGYNKMTAVNGAQNYATSSSANQDLTTVTSTGVQNSLSAADASAANASAYDLSGVVFGAKYTYGKFSAGYFGSTSNLTNYCNKVATAASSPLNICTQANVTANAVIRTVSAISNNFGIGYQATPQLNLGLNYAVVNTGSNMWNTQARYSLSKRTTMYAQATLVSNSNGQWTDGSAFGNFMPVNTNSSTSLVNVGGYGLVSGSSFSGGLPNTNSSAYGVGLIHSF
jgi:predicted porin